LYGNFFFFQNEQSGCSQSDGDYLIWVKLTLRLKSFDLHGVKMCPFLINLNNGEINLTIAIFYLYQFYNMLGDHGVSKLSILGETWGQIPEKSQNVHRFHSVVK